MQSLLMVYLHNLKLHQMREHHFDLTSEDLTTEISIYLMLLSW